MTHLIVELSGYAMVILAALYTFLCFSILKRKEEEDKARGFGFQMVLLFFMHTLAYAVMILETKNPAYLILYGMQVALGLFVQLFFLAVYPNVNRLVLNNLCFLLGVGFIILSRLSYDKAVKQFQIAIAAMTVSFLVPVLVRKLKFLPKLSWLYGIVGIGALAAVAVNGAVSNGAKLSIDIGGYFAIQPSEFVKILFAFFVAARLAKSTALKDVLITSLAAGAHVLILVLSRDLGGALIYALMYVVVLYVATGKLLYLIGGLGAGSGAAVVAYHLFSHVRIRVLAWKDPFLYIDKEGYQITQSLFAIGTGGWMGMGLMQGTPGKIPYVEQDFVFSAIAEELGGIYAICLILICLSCFLMFVNIAMQLKEPFYKLTAMGLGTIYGVQVFLTIGGGIKFIPSTGVTLPLVSYGGSSMLATVLTFAIIQGLYLLREDEERRIEKRKKKIKES